MSAADQTERWTLCIDRSMPLHLPSVARNCAHRPPSPPIEHVEVVPAAALDAAREEIERWRKEYVALEEHDYEAVYSAERAEAELAKAKKLLRRCVIDPTSPAVTEDIADFFEANP